MRRKVSAPALWPAVRGRPRLCGPAAVAVHNNRNMARWAGQPTPPYAASFSSVSLIKSPSVPFPCWASSSSIFLHAVIRQLLKVLFRLLQVILGDLGSLLLLLERTPWRPGGCCGWPPCRFRRTCWTCLASSLRRSSVSCGKIRRMTPAVILGIDAQIGVLNGLFDGLQQQNRPTEMICRVRGSGEEIAATC